MPSSFVVALTLSAHAVGQVSSMTLQFEECEILQPVLDQFACAGIASIVSDGGTPMIFREGTMILVPSPSTGGNLEITFAATVDRVSLNTLVYNGVPAARITAYDAAGGTVSFVDAPPTGFVELTGAGIIKLGFTSDESWGIDNLSYDFESATFSGCANTCEGLPPCEGDPDRVDRDQDGTCDDSEECPADPSKTEAGICGCGVAETPDSDRDGALDCIDACPADPLKVAPGICGCGVSDQDLDGDGTVDCLDACPADPLKIAPGICGCGVVDESDSDDDGVLDCVDLCLGDDASGDDNTNGVCNDRENRTLSVTSSFDGAAGPCPVGGTRIAVGRDENGSLGLDEAEVQEVLYVCNESDILVRSALVPESAKCAYGGVQTDEGRDVNNDGVLQDNEVLSTRLVCSEHGRATRTIVVPPGSDDCETGGVRVESGIDTNGDKTLDDDEVTSSNLVCNEHDFIARSVAVPPGSGDCEAGGVRVESGIDVNGNERLDRDEVTSSRITCNENRFTVQTTVVSPGSGDCEAGGVRVESGFDVNGNERLDEEELAHDDIVCHQGQPLFETESMRVGSSACPHGGTRIRLGYDDGEPSGTAGDGRLQRGEVELVQDVCTELNESDAPALVLGGGNGACSASPGVRGQRSWAFLMSVLVGSVWVRRRRGSVRG